MQVIVAAVLTGVTLFVFGVGCFVFYWRSGKRWAWGLSVAAMSLGIIERCLELSLEYAKTCVRFGKPIGEHQLIQEKLAKMEMHRLNVENMVFRTIETHTVRKWGMQR